MFTWICPQCGREVPPSDNECPDCANRKVTRERQPSPVRGSTGALKPAPPTRARGHLPGWLLSVIFAVVFVGLGGAAYFGYRHLRGGKQPADAVDLESPAGAATDPTPAPKAPSIVDRYVEVAGLRLTEDLKQNAQVRFLVVNHSGAEIVNLAGSVTLRPSTAKPEDPGVGTFSFKVPSLQPYEAKDLTAPVRTKLRAYEIPDWQFLRVDIKITSP